METTEAELDEKLGACAAWTVASQDRHPANGKELVGEPDLRHLR